MDSVITEIVKSILEACFFNLKPLQIKKGKASMCPKWSKKWDSQRKERVQIVYKYSSLSYLCVLLSKVLAVCGQPQSKSIKW